MIVEVKGFEGVFGIPGRCTGSQPHCSSARGLTLCHVNISVTTQS
jgi:hypothetical protein